MMMELYVIWDRVAFEAGPIFQAKNCGVAWRQYQLVVQGQKLDPGDFKLYRVGYYDNQIMYVEAEKPSEITERDAMSEVEVDEQNL